MPICPGCGREVPHSQLASHETYCAYLHGGDSDTMSAIEHLDHRIAVVEQCLQSRMQRLERELNTSVSSPGRLPQYKNSNKQ